MQADNYFKVRSGADSLEFPFVTEYSTDAARAEALANAAADAANDAGGHAVISVYDSRHFPDYPQIGDWAEQDLRPLGELEAELH